MGIKQVFILRHFFMTERWKSGGYFGESDGGKNSKVWYSTKRK